MVDLGRDGPYPWPFWVCPDDRQLALRGKLSTGWCMRAFDMTSYRPKYPPLSEEELEYIKIVVRKAEEMDAKDKDRIGRLVVNLERLKQNLMGDGERNCILCGERFHFFGMRGYPCYDCSKLACHRCRIVTNIPSGRIINLCKICYETKEIWKKSGDWLYNPMPVNLPPEAQTSVLQRLRDRFRRNSLDQLESDERSAAERRSSATDRRSSTANRRRSAIRLGSVDGRYSIEREAQENAATRVNYSAPIAGSRSSLRFARGNGHNPGPSNSRD